MKNLLKKIVLSVLTILIGGFIHAQNESFTISFNSENFKIERSGEYNHVVTDLTGLYYKDGPGKPALPYLPVNFAVPYGSTFINLSLSYDTVLLSSGITIQPMQLMVPLGIKSKKQNIAEPIKEIYNSSLPFPENRVAFTSSQLMSCYQFFTFDVSPFIYLPQQKELYLVSNLTVNITYSSDPEPEINKYYDDGTFWGILQQEVINPDALNPGNCSNVTSRTCEYLIITSESLKDHFLPLANWKIQKGISTQIVTVEDIYSDYDGELQQEKIKKCIEDFHQNKGTMFVLLGGDLEIVPVMRCYASDGVGPGFDADNSVPTDLYYACFDGTFNWDYNNNKLYGEVEDNIDIAPEVFITRAPVQTPLHTSIFVEKTLNYEKDPPLSGFANEMLNFGIEVFGSWNGRCDGAWLSDRMIDDYIDPFWDGIHHSFYSMDSTGISYNINDSLVKSEFNKGYNFNFMASHGLPDYWCTPMGQFFNINNVYELTNNEQGIVVTIACLTNAFDDFLFASPSGPWLTQYDSCFSEAFLRNPVGGAVAYHGSSRYGLGLAEPISDLGPSFLYAANLFKCLFSGQPYSNKFTLGAIATQTKIHLIGASLEYSSYRWLQFTINTLGDATLDLYTSDPLELTLVCPDSIPLGNNQQIDIQTGNPFKDICIQNGQDVYITGKTDASGVYSCIPSPLHTNPLIVTGSGHNTVYITDTIRVGPPQGAVVKLEEYTFTSGDDEHIEYCENVEVNLVLKNIGIDTAYNTSITLSCNDAFIQMNTSTALAGDIPPGESITITDAMNFDVNCYVPDKHRCYPEIEISCNTSAWKSTMEFMMYAPDISIEDIHLESGNYYAIRPNDSANIHIDIKNRGGADAADIRAYLTSGGGNLFIYDFIDTNLTVLQAGELGTLHYAVYSQATTGSEIQFVHETNANHFSRIDAFNLQVIDSLENFETGDFTLYPWDLSQGDSKWVIDSANRAFNGSFCARSGKLTKNHISVLQLETDILANGFISFYKKTSSNNGLSNVLTFLIDSIEQNSWPGFIDWSKEVFPVTTGLHKFTWIYEKSVTTINDTTDCVWIDYIAFPDFDFASSGAISDLNAYENNLHIFPNPNDGKFHIVSSQDSPYNATIEIFNLQGKLIYYKILPGLIKNTPTLIDAGKISKGIYFVKLNGEQSIWIDKIIVY